jgi:glutaminyl-peptide cyclotransferase
MSDGSSTLTFRDPDTFAVLGSVNVVDDGTPVFELNELEWIRGEVFANVYGSDRIARIDPDTGELVAWVDLTGLLDRLSTDAGVLNGIAWDDAGGRLFVTGKLWPSLFEIEMVGCPELRLFGDGFESGQTVRWSVTEP